MPRRVPIPAPSLEVLAPTRTPLLSLEIAVVTPLFGGATQPAVTDPLLPVRASSVRGQLRFWWRACNASRFPTAAELFHAEESIWGSSHRHDEAGSGPSAVDISIELLDAGQPASCAHHERRPDGRWRGPLWREGYPGYALFPFQGEGGNPTRQPAVAREGVRFRLNVFAAPYPRRSAAATEEPQPLDSAVESAIWAWLAFGGIGARTRRGCGALLCVNEDERFRPLGPPRDWIERTARRNCSPGTSTLPVSRLSHARLAIGAQNAPLLAWNNAVRLLLDFRQGVKGQGRRGQEPRTGQPAGKRWPEAEFLRQRLGIGAPTGRSGSLSVSYFPRADLGLPIIFQRLDSTNSHLQVTLQADTAGRTRMASPIIVKPLALSETSAVPIALLLNAPHIWDQGDTPASLIFHNGKEPLQRGDLDDAAKSAHIAGLAGRATARDAFLSFATNTWHTEALEL